jgi:hypothetical protein
MHPVVSRYTGDYLLRAKGPYVHWDVVEQVHGAVYTRVVNLAGWGLDFAIEHAIAEELES